jgi:DNA-binding NtrC family response regulator
MVNRWDEDWETRPLERGPVFTVPNCTLATAQGQEHCFTGQRVTLGSAPDNDLVLSDETVSRHHARILRSGDRYLLQDLGSTNGSAVNGVSVKEAYLEPGMALALGSVELRFAVAARPVAGAPLAVNHLGALVGRSEPMREVFAIISQVAPAEVPVLITGETGTGKEVVARTLHELSPRCHGPFVVVDCSAIPGNLIEAELFGHERGSFSGAIQSREGLFELADGGTLFLDEVGELPLELLPKLLRALETGRVRRVGGRSEQTMDFRLLSATHQDLAGMVQAGRFRADLYYRLNVIPLVLPPLRERRDDIELLLAHFMAEKGLDAETVMTVLGRLRPVLALAPLDGNVRELRNLLERALAAPEAPLEVGTMAGDRPVRGATSRVITDFKRAKEAVVTDFERTYLAGLLAHTGGNLSAAARLAGMDRKYLRELLKRYRLHGEGRSADETVLPFDGAGVPSPLP